MNATKGSLVPSQDSGRLKAEAPCHYDAKYFAQQSKTGRFRGWADFSKFGRYVRGDMKVIDFGCGGGWILSALTAREKTGVELNPLARAHAESLGLKAVESLEQLPPDSADVVISHHCLEHVPYPIEALREAARVLRAGGRLVLVTPLDDWRVQHDHTGKDIDHHLYTWTPRLMANCLVEAGFAVENIKVSTRAIIPKGRKLVRYIPRFLFEPVCFMFSALAKRRELIAVGSKTAK